MQNPTSISPMHSYAFICTKYAKICKICKHESYMQHMQKYALPTLLMKVRFTANNKLNSPSDDYLQGSGIRAVVPRADSDSRAAGRLAEAGPGTTITVSSLPRPSIE